MNAFRQVRSAHQIRRLSFLLLVVCTALLLLALHACGQESIVQTQSELKAKSQVQNQITSQLESRSPAQSNTGQFFKWKNVNIQGMGYVTGLAIAPISPYDVYIRTDIGGAYRFIRQTNQWLPLLDMFDTNFAKGGIGVESIAIDPTLPKRIYVVVNHKNSSFKAGDGRMQYKYAGEVMVSDNQAGSWKSTDLGKNNIFVGPAKAYRSDTGERLAVDPNKSGLLYFASRRDGLWKKETEAWTRVLGGLPDPNSLPAYKNPDGSDNEDIPGFTFVAFDKNSGSLNNPSQIIYVGVHGSGVWRSTNGGTSWSNIAGGNDPLRSAIADDGTLYVSFGTTANNGNKANGGVRQYKNGAWTDITPDGTDKVYSAVTVQQNQANTVMAISDKYVYRSTDGGKNWRKGASNNFPTWLVRPAIVPNPTKKGDVWMSFSRNQEDVNGNKLYRSLDGGKTFSVVASVDSCEFMTFGKGSSDAKPYIYIFWRVKAATKDTMYKSENMGKSWIAISNPNLQQFPGLTYLEGDMRSPNLIYAGLLGRGIMYGEGSNSNVRPRGNST